MSSNKYDQKGSTIERLQYDPTMSELKRRNLKLMRAFRPRYITTLSPISLTHQFPSPQVCTQLPEVSQEEDEELSVDLAPLVPQHEASPDERNSETGVQQTLSPSSLVHQDEWAAEECTGKVQPKDQEEPPVCTQLPEHTQEEEMEALPEGLNPPVMQHETSPHIRTSEAGVQQAMSPINLAQPSASPADPKREWPADDCAELGKPKGQEEPSVCTQLPECSQVKEELPVDIKPVVPQCETSTHVRMSESDDPRILQRLERLETKMTEMESKIGLILDLLRKKQ